MAGYAIQARVVSVRPRRMRSVHERADDESRAMAMVDVARLDADPDAAIDRAPSLGRSERVARTRELWSQMTFFLFDPNSWR